MGVLSALTIGPCVTAPLAGALIYIGESGDAVLGGLALFSLSLGMGLPLLAIGTSAGKLMPRSGVWVEITKAFFGVGLMAVAVWLLARITAPAVTLSLWGLLLIVPLAYLGWKRLWKVAGALALTYAMLLLIGVATRQQRDYLEFLCNAAVACLEKPSPGFKRITTTAALEQSLSEAYRQGRWVLLEFYADWCASCQELQRYTFSDAEVQTALSSVVMLQADVTQNNAEAQALLKRFGIVGPPAMLFFGLDQAEQKSYRIVGFINSEKFLTHIRQIIR